MVSQGLQQTASPQQGIDGPTGALVTCGGTRDLAGVRTDLGMGTVLTLCGADVTPASSGDSRGRPCEDRSSAQLG